MGLLTYELKHDWRYIISVAVTQKSTVSLNLAGTDLAN